MIKKINEEIRKNHGVVRLNELAEKLDMDPRAVEGILQTLNRGNAARRLRTRTLVCSQGICAGCPLLSDHNHEICGYRAVMKLSTKTDH